MFKVSIEEKAVGLGLGWLHPNLCKAFAAAAALLKGWAESRFFNHIKQKKTKQNKKVTKKITKEKTKKQKNKKKPDYVLHHRLQQV